MLGAVTAGGLQRAAGERGRAPGIWGRLPGSEAVAGCWGPGAGAGAVTGLRAPGAGSDRGAPQGRRGGAAERSGAELLGHSRGIVGAESQTLPPYLSGVSMRLRDS